MGGQITPRIRLKVPALVHGIVISSTIGYFANRTKEEQEEFVRKRTAPPPPGTDPVTANMMVVEFDARADLQPGPRSISCVTGRRAPRRRR